MTGPEHYLEAEKALAGTTHLERGAAADMSLLAEAQVHATLALAAATALRGAEGLPTEDRHAWSDAASTSVARKRGTAAAVRVA